MEKVFIDCGLFLQFPRKLMFTWTFDQHIQGLGRTQKKIKIRECKKAQNLLKDHMQLRVYGLQYS